jgi:hypothetical protein
VAKNDKSSLTTGGFLLRFVFAIVIVLATYNPTEYSYYSWIMKVINSEELALGPEHFLVGIVLLIGWTIYIRATGRALGPFGLLLGGAFLGTLVWTLIDFGIIAASSVTALTWIALICVAALLAIGMSWSHIRRRLSGQVDTGDVES